MTAQFPEALKYIGKKYHLATELLRSYLQAMNIECPATSTANNRGYISSWEVIYNKLYQ